MPATEFALNDPLAVHRYSRELTVEAAVNAYFSRFEGGKESMIYVKNELQKGAGEKITCGIRMKVDGEPAYGDEVIKGHGSAEKGLDFFHDSIFIDQMRKTILTKGKATEQRVPYNLRMESKDAQRDYWTELDDQMTSIYLSGARGSNTGWNLPVPWTGQKTTNGTTIINPIQAPDAGHLVFAGDATGSADLDASDVMTLQDIDRLKVLAKMMNPKIMPLKFEGQNKYIMLMHYFQGLQMRQATGENDWLAIHKATDRGSKAMMYKDAIGEYAGVVMHEHDHCILFDDYGSGSDLPAARSLLLGAQAGLKAYGQKNQANKFSTFEELDDRGNALAVTCAKISGIKGTQYDSKWFGRIAMDSYVAVPN